MTSDESSLPRKRNLAVELSTPATIALFVVVGVSGVMLLFKIGEGFVKGAHEWLGLVFVIAGGIHVFRHWRATKKYFTSRAFWAVAAIVGVITIAFVAPSAGGGHGNPMFTVVTAVAGAPIERVAPILGTTPQDMMAKLDKAGIKVEGPTQTLEEVANKSGRHLFQIIELAAASPKGIDGNSRLADH